MTRKTRYSKKREAILDAIGSTTCHPSAEWVYQTLKATHTDLSLGTVYRNLLFFRQQGSIQSVGVVHGQERFDRNLSPHSHFICSHCGVVLDLDDLSYDPRVMQTIHQQYGLLVHRQELTFHGLCNDCIKHKEEQ